MLKVGIVGCTGKLGKSIIDNIDKTNNIEVAYAIARKGNPFVGKDLSVITRSTPKGLVIIDDIVDARECDVFIDCTTSETFMKSSLAQYETVKKPILIATTGFTGEEFSVIKNAAIHFPVLFSANYSIALYNFIETVKCAVTRMDEGTDVHIIEYHHSQKKDAPSGTAIRIKEAILEANSSILSNRVNISSIRAGNIYGEHRVILANCHDEIIELVHKVSSREAFANGIIKVADWLVKQPNGYYGLDDMLKIDGVNFKTQ
ncbi:MAG: 4-hydroxy-tetrahydrodipicolinate reductase [Cellulosilyticaceae bacterium]